MTVSSTSGYGPQHLLAHGATGLLAEFNTAGVLDVADVRTAEAVARMGQEHDDRVRLALALAVRALRNGSVCVDLRTVDTIVFDEDEEGVDVTQLPWPEVESWIAAVHASPLVADGADRPGGHPLRLAYGLLYLERYWQQEEQVRRQLQHRLAAPLPEVDSERLAAALARLFPRATAPAGPDRQRLAAAVAAAGWVTVLAGAPGTGKTTTVARLLALLADQPGRDVRVALAAPTGKAAARLEEAVRSAAAKLEPADRGRLGPLNASTLHRLLGWLPASQGRFRHNATNQLPHDVVIVDEMSMVSLTMTARLLEAVRPTARLVLVGDPDQLSSVEAGAVLADIVRAPGTASTELMDRLQALGVADASDPPVHGVVQLTHTWRYGDAIDALARAIRGADADAAMEVLRSGGDEVHFFDTEPAGAGMVPAGSMMAALSERVIDAGRQTRQAAIDGQVVEALGALDHHRLLCAHRRGPYGVLRWGLEVERWLAEAIPGYAEDGEWYLGRPVLVTANDYDMGLYNGDTGVIVNTPAGVRAAFARGAEPMLYPPVRLDAIQTVHAMTVHRAQGSQFDTVSFIVPGAESPLLTRELLYTAVTRASKRVQVFGTEEAVRRAISRPANRASGLANRLGSGT